MKKSAVVNSFSWCLLFMLNRLSIINYQAVLRDANGNILPNTTIKTSSVIEIDAVGFI